MQTKSLLRIVLPVIIVVLFVGTSAVGIVQPTNTPFIKVKATSVMNRSSRDQVELKYYDQPTYDIGVDAGVVWQSAIRLTQKELSPYNTWNLTKVVVGFDGSTGQESINVTIIIYDNGTPTHPGGIIWDDTKAVLNGTDLFTIPLVHPVTIARHTELWVAVEWFQTGYAHYAVMDEGPAVQGKGDWVYLNNRWQETYASLDYNWCIGAIINGTGMAQLMIGNIKGPTGIKTEVQNTCDIDAQNVVWSIGVKGGILGKINKTMLGTDTTLVAHTNLAINLPMFIGFGKISIMIKVKAENALEVDASKSAFILGPFVIGIK